ncbi:MAG: autotransporter-associated beta strand repeat-containing protein, partial [Planctomycetota bacterium]|nr:autotransporter-associated beta strand repeat-containing protein [Planctomycetota bacterium]
MRTNLSILFRNLLACGAIIAATCGACTSPAHAADATWLGGVSSDWGATDINGNYVNWKDGTPPSSGIYPVFGTAGSNPSVDLGDTDRSVGRIFFNSDVNTTISSASSKKLNAELWIVQGGSHQITADILPGSPNVRLMGYGDLTLGYVRAYTLAIGSNEGRGTPVGMPDTYTSGTVTLLGDFVQTGGGCFIGDLNYEGLSPVTVAIGGNIYNSTTWVNGYTVLLPGIKVTVLPGQHRIEDAPNGVYVNSIPFDGPGDLIFGANAVMDSATSSDKTVTYTMNGTGRVIFGGLGEWMAGMTMVKEGSGTMVIQGIASYTGNTNVNAGTLLVNGTHTGGDNYTVSGTGTLGGTGAITLAAGKTVTVQSGGTLAPGASVGTLTINNNMTLDKGGAYLWEIDNTSGTPGADWDLLKVNGTLNITADATDKFLIKVASGAPAASGVFTIAETSGIVGFDPNYFTFDTTGWTGIADIQIQMD